MKRRFGNLRSEEAVVIICPAFLAAIVIICISTPSIRYIYNLLPFYVVFVGYIITVLKNLYAENEQRIKKMIGKFFALILLCSNIVLLLVVKPDFLYEEYKQYDQFVQAYDHCVYITDNINPCITSDLCQLLNFEEVFVSNVSNISSGYQDICNYIKSLDVVVIYIAKYKNLHSCDEITNMLLDEMQGCKIEYLYEGDFSVTYLLKRTDFDF